MLALDDLQIVDEIRHFRSDPSMSENGRFNANHPAKV